MYRTRSTSESIHESNSPQASSPDRLPISDQKNTSIGGLGSQSIQHLAISTPADNAPASELSAKNSLGLMPDVIPPPVTGPKVINTDSWVGSSETPSMSGKTNAPDPFVLAAARRDRLPDQPNYLWGPDSWDNLYVDAHGVVKSAWDKNWDGLYVDAHGVVKSAWDQNWDGLYVDAHGVTKSTWDKRWETLDDNVPSPPQNDLNHAHGFPMMPVGSLDSITPAYTSSHDAGG